MNDPRFQGHCFVCGKPTWEILREAPKDSPLAGEPIKLGKPLKDAVRCELVLLSGRRVSVTVHSYCSDLLEKNLSKHWKTILAATKYEEDTRPHRKVRPRTDAQQKAVDDFNAKLATDVPLGVLTVEKWSELPR